MNKKKLKVVSFKGYVIAGVIYHNLITTKWGQTSVDLLGNIYHVITALTKQDKEVMGNIRRKIGRLQIEMHMLQGVHVIGDIMDNWRKNGI